MKYSLAPEVVKSVAQSQTRAQDVADNLLKITVVLTLVLGLWEFVVHAFNNSPGRAYGEPQSWKYPHTYITDAWNQYPEFTIAVLLVILFISFLASILAYGAAYSQNIYVEKTHGHRRNKYGRMPDKVYISSGDETESINIKEQNLSYIAIAAAFGTPIGLPAYLFVRVALATLKQPAKAIKAIILAPYKLTELVTKLSLDAEEKKPEFKTAFGDLGSGGSDNSDLNELLGRPRTAPKRQYKNPCGEIVLSKPIPVTGPSGTFLNTQTGKLFTLKDGKSRKLE
jgi:hypothetical protein